MKIDAKREVLVLGATGTVGSEVARATVAQGGGVRAMVRSESSACRLPRGVVPVRGDLRDRAALEAAVRDAGAVFYVSPHEPDEEALAESVIRACNAAGARLVFVGVHVDAPSRVGRAARRFLFGRMLAHYRPKFRLSERVRTKSAEPVILMPTNFFQNDELFRSDIDAGIFAQPFDRPINRVDARDIGEAGARALLDPGLPPGAYPIVGPRSLTGADCAAVWSTALGRPVRYDGDERRFREMVARALTGKKRDDFLASYAAIRKLAIPTAERDLARTTALLGRPPTSYESYVRTLDLGGRANEEERSRPAPRTPLAQCADSEAAR
jgi:uncharacterized protein YbjT (DUF2867 family)